MDGLNVLNCLSGLNRVYALTSGAALSVGGGIEANTSFLTYTDELMRQPSNRVQLPTTARVLNEIPQPNALFGSSGKQLPYHVKLMVAGKDLLALLFTGLRILVVDDLSMVLKNVGKARGVRNCFQR